jgi:hypothetical protein
MPSTWPARRSRPAAGIRGDASIFFHCAPSRSGSREDVTGVRTRETVEAVQGSEAGRSADTLKGSYFTFTQYAGERMPLATTNSALIPVSALAGTSNWVDTFLLPVATAIVLWLCVRQ